MKNLILCLCMLCIAATAFGQKETTKKARKAKKAKQEISQTPPALVQAVMPVAKMEFTEQVYEYGTITSGDVVEHTFTFTNTGEAPLLIQGAKSTCGCTVPTFPKEAVLPGESGQISVKFNSKNKSGRQRKPVNITANTNPQLTTVYIDGTVKKAPVEGSKPQISEKN